MELIQIILLIFGMSVAIGIAILIVARFRRSTVASVGASLDVNQLKRLNERLTSRQDDFGEVRLPELPKVPGMISPNECRYLYWLTSKGYTGSGAVVELGTFLGRSTIHLASGIRDSGYTTKLHCADLFKWNKAFNNLSIDYGLNIEHGDDFQPYFEANVRPVYDNIKVIKSALRDYQWEGGPIEILFLDAPKSMQDISVTLPKFARHLVPGLSIVVMQDYLHSPSFPLAMVLSTLRGELELIHTVSLSSTASFAVTKHMDFYKPLPEWNFFKWNRKQMLDAWDHILKPLDPQPRNYLEPGLSMMLMDVGDEEEALRRIRHIEFTAEGLERWKFLGNLPQYYEKYKPLFDATIDPTVELASG